MFLKEKLREEELVFTVIDSTTHSKYLLCVTMLLMPKNKVIYLQCCVIYYVIDQTGPTDHLHA